MNTFRSLPLFEENFPDLNQFILGLVTAYESKQINSWDDLDDRVKSYFSADVMDAIEAKVPGWKKMASYADGITLTHITCVFLGMSMLDEFRELSPEEQQAAKWIILFHDAEKFHIRGKKDTMHPFNGATLAAKIMPGFGFPVSGRYEALIGPWSMLTRQAFIPTDVEISPKPDNQKLPEILAGIDQMFGEETPVALIVKTVLLHVSLAVDKNYPTPAPLTDDEVKRYISPALLSLLRIMMLSDNEGWALFEPEFRFQQRSDALEAFEGFQKLIGLNK